MVAVGRQNELAEPAAFTHDLSSVMGLFGSSGEMARVGWRNLNLGAYRLSSDLTRRGFNLNGPVTWLDAPLVALVCYWRAAHPSHNYA